MSDTTPGRSQRTVLFICKRAIDDPIVDQVSRELDQVIVRATTPDDGLAQARARDFALILVGYSDDAKGMLETIRAVRANGRSSRTPVVAIGLPQPLPFAQELLYEAGAIAVLTEPLSPTILRAKARFYIDAFNSQLERHRAEAELRRMAADLSEANRLKTEFLATLAHELRNPLAPIRSGLQFIRRSPGDLDAVTRVHDIMERQLDHLVSLVDDLLDVARITRGQVELRRERVDLATILAAATETSMPLIEAARHQFDLHLPAGTLVLEADPTRLTQVVSNLLNNAARYTPKGGSIVLAAAREGDDALVTVSDNGIGIAPEALDEVFRMFTQVGQAQQPGSGGLGIGLSLVRSLVELHGGSVSAVSAGTNAGSVFTVRLPLAPDALAATDADASAADAAGAAPPGRSVLVVDDNRDAAETLAALLNMMGHRAPVANDGRQALRMLPSLMPDVVFLDLGMPGMSGYDVAAAIRQDARLAGIRLVALTGWGGEADRAKTRAAGFDEHLTKPATVEAIEDVLRRV